MPATKHWEQSTFDCNETQACRYRIKAVADVVLAGMEQELDLEAAEAPAADRATSWTDSGLTDAPTP